MAIFKFANCKRLPGRVHVVTTKTGDFQPGFTWIYRRTSVTFVWIDSEKAGPSRLICKNNIMCKFNLVRTL